MPEISDPIEHAINMLRPILRQLLDAGIQIGEQGALDRVIAAVRPTQPQHTPLITPITPALPDRGFAGDLPAAAVSLRRYPYGAVRKAIKEIVDAATAGITRADIREMAKFLESLDIDDETAKNTLKVMARRNEAHVSNGVWFPGPRGSAGNTGEAPPVPSPLIDDDI